MKTGEESIEKNDKGDHVCRLAANVRKDLKTLVMCNNYIKSICRGGRKRFKRKGLFSSVSLLNRIP